MSIKNLSLLAKRTVNEKIFDANDRAFELPHNYWFQNSSLIADISINY